ncbi:hypothetical protein [Marivivens marinus]|uniref:hypothetical protein n=1 Tax=Marivivens marinus TaxID=3110173 RepID=UPI003B84B36C
MWELMLPYLIGTALGITPAPDGMAPDTMAAAPAAAETALEDLSVREPEPQVPTGKFTTAVEIKPILGMTKGNWVAVRLYEGQDLLYFTHLLSWRCGMWEVRYGLNGAPAETVFPLEPCHEDTASPNSMTDMVNYLPYVTLPPESVDSIYVEIFYDDGTSDFAQFNRNEVLIP